MTPSKLLFFNSFAELEFRRMAEILLGESLPVEEKTTVPNQKSKPKDLNQIDSSGKGKTEEKRKLESSLFK